MFNGDEKICSTVENLLNQNEVLEAQTQIQNATKFSVKSGANKASILVFNTGSIVVQGTDSALKKWLEELKTSVLDGNAAPGILLPADIEKFPTTLQQLVPECDEVVLWFFKESLTCFKAGSISGSAFMLGAASEKAINLLIDGYATSIKDGKKQESFRNRTNSQVISKKYEEFKQSYKSSIPSLKSLPVGYDLELLLDNAFNFYRYTRNSIGHPQIIPDLDKGVVLANIGQFITYVERIYRLLEFFQKSEITV